MKKPFDGTYNDVRKINREFFLTMMPGEVYVVEGPQWWMTDAGRMRTPGDGRSWVRLLGASAITGQFDIDVLTLSEKIKFKYGRIGVLLPIAVIVFILMMLALLGVGQGEA